MAKRRSKSLKILLIRRNQELIWKKRGKSKQVNQSRESKRFKLQRLRFSMEGGGRRVQTFLQRLGFSMGGGGRRVHPDCKNASNPYHECVEYCFRKIAEAKARQEKATANSSGIDDDQFRASGSVRREEKQQQVRERPGSDDDYRPPEENVEGNITMLTGRQKKLFELRIKMANGTPRGSFTGSAVAAPKKQKENEEVQASPKAAPPPMVKGEVEIRSGPFFQNMKFCFSGISRASEENNDEEAQSVISDSSVSVGKYHVRASVAPVLQSVIDKHGDIAANCRLQSVSMRGHFLEGLCSVVLELRSTPFKQLTRSKIEEFLAVLKDVESIGIDVSWLHGMLDELTEAIEVNNQHQAAEMDKANCDGAIELTKREIESLMEELAEKDKAVADTKAQIEDARALLSDLELEYSQLSDTISLTRSKVETYHSKSFADKILLKWCGEIW